jgi:hypothetical protein
VWIELIVNILVAQCWLALDVHNPCCSGYFIDWIDTDDKTIFKDKCVNIFQVPALDIEMIIDTSHLLVGVNSAANFFLYYLLRKNFRSATWRLLTCKGLDQQGRGHYSNRTNNGGQSAVPTSITLNNGDRSNRITNLSRNATLVECTTPTRSVTIIAQLSVWCVRSSFKG